MKQLKKLSVKLKLIITASVSALVTSIIWMSISANNMELRIVDSNDPNFEAAMSNEESTTINMITSVDKKSANTTSTLKPNGCSFRGKFYNEGEVVYTSNYRTFARWESNSCKCKYNRTHRYGYISCSTNKLK